MCWLSAERDSEIDELGPLFRHMLFDQQPVAIDDFFYDSFAEVAYQHGLRHCSHGTCHNVSFVVMILIAALMVMVLSSCNHSSLLLRPRDG